MLLRRWISIPLAIIAILCAAACIYIFFFTINYTSNYITYKNAATTFKSLVLTDIPYISLVMLAPMNIALSAALLIGGGKRTRPLLITIWGAGVLFLSILPVVRFLMMEYSALLPFPLYRGLLKAIPIVSMLSGVAACFFGWAHYRRRINDALLDSPTTIPLAQPAGVMTVEKVTNLLYMLNRVNQAGTLPTEEYDRKRKHYLSFLTRQM